MKDKLPKNILIPFLIGIAFCLFLILANNANLFSDNVYLNVFAILLGAVVLYGSLFGIIRNHNNLLLGIGGFHFGRVLLLFFLLLAGFIYQKFFRTETPDYKSLIEKENIILKPDFAECHKIKYGKFLVGYDTIIRSKSSKKDIEKVIKESGTYTYNIRWLDSCSYYRVVDKNQSVKDVVKLGNFEGLLHDMYIRPAALHYIDEERITKAFPLEIYAGPVNGN